jgi:hypothetical protein
MVSGVEYEQTHPPRGGPGQATQLRAAIASSSVTPAKAKSLVPRRPFSELITQTTRAFLVTTISLRALWPKLTRWRWFAVASPGTICSGYGSRALLQACVVRAKISAARWLRQSRPCAFDRQPFDARNVARLVNIATRQLAVEPLDWQVTNTGTAAPLHTLCKGDDRARISIESGCD